MLNISDDNDLAEIIQKCMINEYVRYEIHYICSIISKLVMESKINFKWEQENENSNLMLRYIQIFGNVGKRTDIMMWEIFDWYAE